MWAYVWFENVGKVLFEQVAIEFAHVFFVEFLGLAHHVYQGADIVNEEAEYDTAHDLDKGAEESFNVVYNLIWKLLTGTISPNPTVAKTVAPQYHPTTYCSKSDVTNNSFPYTHVSSIPKLFYTLLKDVNTSDRLCNNKNTLNTKLTMDNIISVSVDIDMIFSNFFAISDNGLKIENDRTLRITNKGVY